MKQNKLLTLFSLLIVASVVLTACGGAAATATQAPQQDGFVIGVSNTLVGNGWREQMICSIKAEATASGLLIKSLSLIAMAAQPSRLPILKGLFPRA